MHLPPSGVRGAVRPVRPQHLRLRLHHRLRRVPVQRAGGEVRQPAVRLGDGAVRLHGQHRRKKVGEDTN